MIETFLDKIAVRYRKKSGTGSAVESWESKDTNLLCAIDPINPNDTLAFQSNYLRLNITHKMF